MQGKDDLDDLVINPFRDLVDELVEFVQELGAGKLQFLERNCDTPDHPIVSEDVDLDTVVAMASDIVVLVWVRQSDDTAGIGVNGKELLR